jgi:hypothetical protein
MKKTMVLLTVFLGLLNSAQAAQSDLSSQSPASTQTYKITDGYGTYVGHGETSLKAREQAWEGCVASKVLQYEARFGATPDADTADLFIDACINR